MDDIIKKGKIINYLGSVFKRAFLRVYFVSAYNDFPYITRGRRSMEDSFYPK